MSTTKKNVLYNGILTGSNLIFPLIGFIYVTKILGLTNYGKVSFINSFIQYFVVLSTLGVPYYGIREIAKVKDDNQKRSQLFVELLLTHLLLTMFIVILYAILIFTIPRLRIDIEYYLLGLISLFCLPFSVYWYFNGVGNFRFVAIRTLIILSIQFFMIVVFVNSTNDTFIFFFIQIFFVFLTTVMNLAAVKKSIHFKSVKFRLNILKHIKPMMLIFLFTVATSIYELLDSIILGFLASESAVGLYNSASRIIKIPIILVGVLSPVLLPKISEEFQKGNKSLIESVIKKSISYVIFISFPIILGISYLSNDIILVLTSSEFVRASTTILIMCPIPLLIGLTTIFTLQILTPLSKDKYLIIPVLVGVLFSLALNFVLVPILKENGSAIASLVSELFVMLISFYYAFKFVNIKVEFDNVLQSLLASLLFYIPIRLFMLIFGGNFGIIGLLITILVSALFYFCVQLFLFKNKISKEIFEYFIVLMFNKKL